ncbi:LAME_0C05710g1_1 [Lachancea meyersii CBS 8951]|uniref:LAME_0C05710g1_1 n=1 Tax=Lachancea meyersii CBS 8951 TaxID=1266667 RepID=A0A1G4J235_9SACH|nr:LAME_0C05710g1_1 [Lachancea meyersii CBS 8951]
MIRRLLHSLRKHQIPLPSARMAVKVMLPVLAIVAVMVIYIQAAKLGQYTKLSQYNPYAKSHGSPSLSASGFLSPSDFTHIDPNQFGKLPDENLYSPMQLIPKFNSDMHERYKASWDLLGRGHRFKQFEDLSEQAQCYFYFHKVYALRPNWSNDYDKWDFVINDDNLASEDVDDTTRDLLLNHRQEQAMALGTERMRMYDKCFVSEMAEKVDMAKIFSTMQQADPSVGSNLQWDFEKRMWPFLRDYNKSTFENLIPNFIGPSGKTLEHGYLPNIGSNHREEDDIAGATKYVYDEKHSFMWNWNHMSAMVAPKGIVLSFGDEQLELAAKLMAHFRFTGNELPIQVVTKGDISRETIDAVLRIARSDDIEFPQTDYHNAKNVKQTVWFVDVSPTLDPLVKDSFDRFKNKWLAAGLNLFQEYIFLDTDAINYVDMSYFFEKTDYVNTGTLFFKDRFLDETIADKKCPAMVETLVPTYQEEYYFNHFPAVSSDYVEEQCERLLEPKEKTFKDYFFGMKKHQMDSGLVVMDKDSHIVPLMISLMMHMTSKLGGCSYGDKEFFWLGFYISGHDYSFHSSRPGASGVLIHDAKVNKQLKQRKSEVCSITISHLDEHQGLLWVNGGAQNCKFDVAKQDWESQDLQMSSRFTSFEDMQKEYRGPVKMEAGIIPAEKQGAWGKPDQRCKGYYYCARYESQNKPYYFNKVHEKGKTVMFGPEQKDKYNSINKVWVHNYL